MADVPQEVLRELPQILSNLIASDNTIRANAEKAVNERLARAPEAYLLALATFAVNADTEVMRTFSLVLLRRLLFRSLPALTSPTQNTTQNTLYDHLPEATRCALERLVLNSLTHEANESVRRKASDTACDMASGSFERARDWEGLRVWVGEACKAGNWGQKESAYSILANVPTLLHDIPLPTLLPLLHAGLHLPNRPHPQMLSLTHAALRATCAFLSTSSSQVQAQSLSLLPASLSLLPQIPLEELPRFLSVLTTTLLPGNAQLFAPHMSDLLSFMTPLLMPSRGEDPTTAKPVDKVGGDTDTPTSTARGVFAFPPLASSSSPNSKAKLSTNANGRHSSSSSLNPKTPPSEPEPEPEEDTLPPEASLARKAVLEFMVSLAESRPSLIRRARELGTAWIRAVVRGCLEGMSEVGVGSGISEKEWGEMEDSGENEGAGDGEDGEEGTTLFEHSLDRLALALSWSSYGSLSVPPSSTNPNSNTIPNPPPTYQSPVIATAFTYIPAMLVHSSWRVRHAGLIGIACVAEGGRREMGAESGRVVGLVLGMFGDTSARVRWAACQCIGQLCTDLEELIGEEYYDRIINVLIPALEAPEPRVHKHAAAAIINFCETVPSSVLTPYLPALLPRLLHLLQTSPRADVQEQAITTLAMVADASEGAFRDYYGEIMPLLLRVLGTVEDEKGLERMGEGGRRLRCKAMECAGLIAIAVGKEVFRRDSAAMIECLTRIQAQATPLDDPDMNQYLTATWAKLCQAMGSEFEPYLPIVMPPLLHSAGLKADVSVVDADPSESSPESGSSAGAGWETVQTSSGQTIGIKTSLIEEKCHAFEMLVIHVSTLRGAFAPYFARTMELVLPCLRFYFHEGVREACALLIPMLITTAKEANILTQEVFSTTFQQLISVIASEQDASYLGSLYKSFHDSSLVLGGGGGGAIPGTFIEALFKASQGQLEGIAARRKQRAGLVSGGEIGLTADEVGVDEEREELALIEEMEDFALEDMGRCLALFVGQDGGGGAGRGGREQLMIALSSVKELGVIRHLAGHGSGSSGDEWEEE